MEGGSFKGNSIGKERIRKTLRTLESEFQVNIPNPKNPFLSLIRTVLSQNTNRKNTNNAFERLTSKYASPSEIAKADLEDLHDLIRPAGLYRSKAKSLKDQAELILDRYEGNLEKVLSKSLDEARRELLALPGVGPKTADCVLLFAGERDVLPVDTHVSRTSKRLGFADLKDKPEVVKQKVEPLIPTGERGKVHLLLIELGREYCKASNPVCEECPIEDLCPKIEV